MGITGLRYDRENALTGRPFCEQLTLSRPRYAHVERITKETGGCQKCGSIAKAAAKSPPASPSSDHMFDQIATHGGFRLEVKVGGDLYIDDHHTVEDTPSAGRSAGKAGAQRQARYRPFPALCCRWTNARPAARWIFLAARTLNTKLIFTYQRVGDLSTGDGRALLPLALHTMAVTLHLETKAKRPPPR